MEKVVLENKRFLQNNVNPVLELLVADLMRKTPEDPVSFMINWLRSEGRDIQNKIEKRERHRPEGIASSDNEEGEEQDTVEELGPRKVQVVNKVGRASVSAESFGEHNKSQPFIPPTHPKDEQQKARIRARLSASILFSSVLEEDLVILIQAMTVKNFQQGEEIIRQGDQGEEMYVVDEGKLNCYKVGDQGARELITTYGPADCFGELALMYNAPRAATVISATPCTLFTLDRLTFNHILKESVTQRHKKFLEFLSKIDLFSSLNRYEKDKLADCMQLRRFRTGEKIITQGEKGNVFYFILTGRCTARKTDPATGALGEGFVHGPGDYFGELALLRDEPRAATVTAEQDSLLAYIDRPAFKRLLGSLEDIMNRNAQRYSAHDKKSIST